MRRLFNTSGVQYRQLGLKDKLANMSEAEQLAVLASDGLLVKRPVLVGKDFALFGFNQEQWEAALSNKK